MTSGGQRGPETALRAASVTLLLCLALNPCVCVKGQGKWNKIKFSHNKWISGQSAREQMHQVDPSALPFHDFTLIEGVCGCQFWGLRTDNNSRGTTGSSRVLFLLLYCRVAYQINSAKWKIIQADALTRDQRPYTCVLKIELTYIFLPS